MRNENSRRTLRVLVVEDSATQAENLRYILEKEGFEVSVAANGREALERLGKTRPSVVVSDIIMPEMDGFQLCRRMKSDAELKNIPLILLTALSDPKDVLKGLECGADNFITKPYDEEYLLSKLRYVLAGPAGYEPSDAPPGVEIVFQGDQYRIGAGRRQMVDLLLSSYETAVAKNRALVQAQEKLEGLNAQLEKNVDRFKLLSGTAGRLLSSTDPLSIVKELCRQVMEHLDCQVFFNFIVDEDPGRLRLNACAGIPEEEIRKLEWLDYGVAVCGCVARDAVRIIAEDILHTPDPRTALVKSYGVQAYCCHPLMAQGRLIGTLSFGTRTRPAFAPDEIALMKSVTDQVAVAMQRLKAEQALRVSEEKLRSAFANASIGFAIANPEGQFVDANPAYCALTGYKVEELRHLSLRRLIHPDELAENDLLLERMLAGEIHDFVLESRYVRKDGDVVWVRRSVSLVRDSDSAPHFILLLVEDISTRQRAEEQLRNAHGQLQDHARRLQESNRELESFAYSVSHDLRAPLRAISGFARMIFDENGASFDPETRRKFGVIQDNADKMDRLIEGLLRLSRLSRSEMRRSTIDLSRVAREVMEEIRTTENASRVRVEIADLPPLQGDPTLIRQLMMNLLSNAVKFTRRRSEPRIEIGGRKEEAGLIYYVSDNGVGFDMEYYDRLFGVFQRLVSETQFEGAGVGLAIAQRIVQRHGGRIWAEGKPDQGATFYFTIPDQAI